MNKRREYGRKKASNQAKMYGRAVVRINQGNLQKQWEGIAQKVHRKVRYQVLDS